MNDEHSDQPVTEQKVEKTEPKQRRFSMRVPEWSLKRGALLAGVLLIGLGGITGIAYFLDSSFGKSNKIVIGDTIITKEDVDRYEKELGESLNGSSIAHAKDKNGKPKSTHETAIDELVLNAAFKLEVKRMGGSLKESDIREVLKNDSGVTPNVKPYLNSYVSRTNLENEAYKTKFADKLLAKKALLQAYIIFDSPYFSQTPLNKVQAQYDQAQARLKNDIVPMMKAGKTKEEIAKKADVVLFDDNTADDENWQQYFDKPVLLLGVLPEYLPKQNQAFNDLPGTDYIRGNVGKVYPTDQKLTRLKNVGDTTDVFASQAGAFMAFRLESKTNGKYESWDDILAQYRKEYVTNKTTLTASISAAAHSLAVTIKSNLIKTADIIILRVSSIGMEKASAQVPGGCSQHRVRLIIRSIDITGGGSKEIGGTKLTYSRATSGPLCQQYVGTKTITTPYEFYDNCYGNPPNWSSGPTKHPAGYHYEGVRWEIDGVWHYGSMPPWNPGVWNTNSFGLKIEFRYTKNIPLGDWNLTPRSYISDSSAADRNEADPDYYGGWEGPGSSIYVKPGDTVYYLHWIKNSGTEAAIGFDRQRRVFVEDPLGNETSSAVDTVDTSTTLNDGEIMYMPGGRANSTATAPGRAFTVPPGTPAGTRYCQQIRVFPESKDNNAEQYSAPVCAIVMYFELVPNSTVSSDVVELGQSINYAHSLTNIGNVLNWTDPPTDAWPQFNYVYTDPANPDTSWRQGPLTHSWYSNFIAGGETRYYGESEDFYGPSGAAVGKTLPIPTGAGALGRVYCQRYKVFSYSSLVSAERISTPVCAGVVGGKTSVSVTAGSGPVEPTEATSIDISLVTAEFAKYGAWTGYAVNCNYTVTLTDPAGGVTGAPGGNCGGTVDQGSYSFVTKTVNYAPPAGTPVGTKICVRATISTANPNFTKPPTSEESCVPVVAKPYVKSYGSDISVGASFGSGCNEDASVLGWNKGGGANKYAGAGNQFAVFAQNQIRYFASGQALLTTGEYGDAPSKLSFGNTGLDTAGNPILNEPAGLYGGKFRGSQCGIPKYFDENPPSSAYSWSSIRDSNDKSGADLNPIFKGTGNTVIRGNNDTYGGLPVESANVITNGNNSKVYIDGDVYIAGDITAATGATSVSLIPGLTLVVKGDIYIAYNVSKLYGTYVAQPNGAGSGGNIYTCSKGVGAAFSAYDSMTGSGFKANQEAFDNCNNQLVVTGSFVAKKVHLLRTFGSLYKDTNGADGIGGAGYNNAAEVFRYNPLIWMRQSTTATESSSSRSLDAITSLPPIL